MAKPTLTPDDVGEILSPEDERIPPGIKGALRYLGADGVLLWEAQLDGSMVFVPVWMEPGEEGGG